jgi:pimeloyl-ACP methyl ester carboxylesterase
MDPIIFVHGAGLDGRSWDYQTKFFKGSIAVDLPGHGSAAGAAADDVGKYADWLENRVRKLSSAPVALVGHSMGSLIALETAARNPDIVNRLVLVATAATMPVHRDLLTAARNRDPSAAAMVIKWSFPQDEGFGRMKDWVATLSDTFIAAAESGVMAQDFAACDSYRDAIEMAERVRCPTLFLLAERDVMTKPTAAQPLAAAVADARIVVIEGAGHMLPLEKPMATNEAISLFLTMQ